MKTYLLLFFICFCSYEIQAQSLATPTKDHISDSLQFEGSNKTTVDDTQLLTAHELKSNELYDFSIASHDDLLEVSTERVYDNFEIEEKENYGNYSFESEPDSDPQETIFKSNSTKKPKKKKSGKGLLVLTGVVLLLSLISQ